MAVSTKNFVLRDMIPKGLVEIYYHFRETHCLQLQGRRMKAQLH